MKLIMLAIIFILLFRIGQLESRWTYFCNCLGFYEKVSDEEIFDAIEDLHTMKANLTFC